VFDVSVPLGKVEHYMCKKIFGRCVRQVHYALDDFAYAILAVGQMKSGNDARGVTQGFFPPAFDFWMR
jgi:hypothetical protein